MVDVIITFDQLPQTMPVDVLKEAIDLVDRSFHAGSPSEHAAALTDMWSVTVSAGVEGNDMSTKAEAYMRRIESYPADAVSEACRKWSENNRFFPTWCELRPMIDKEMEFRICAKDRLTRCLENSIRELERTDA